MTTPAPKIFFRGNSNDTDTLTSLEDALVSDDDIMKLGARLVATGFDTDILGWVSDEIRRGTDPGDIVIVLARVQAQIFGSLVGNLLTPAADEAAVTVLHMAADRETARTAIEVRKRKREQPEQFRAG